MDGCGSIPSTPNVEDADAMGAHAQWFAAMTHPYSEDLAARHLAFQGFNVFLPYRVRTTRHARKLVTKRSAYFSRYLFVSLDIQRQRWRSVNSTIGVSSLVMSGSKPLPIPHGVVEALKSATDHEGILRPSNLVPGQKVRVAAGAFLDQLGTLDRVDEDGAVKILLEIMNRYVSVRLHRDQIVVVA